jgi:homopolymeric O-antigen transport system permease protein
MWFGNARFANTAPLMWTLVVREVAGRYRGSLLGTLWSLITPLMMLGIYTFVFGTVFHSRWSAAGAETSTAEFAIVIFMGLIIFQIFGEVVNRGPGLVLANANYVKRVVFPLELLVPVALGSALFHAAVSFAVLIVFMLAALGGIPITAIWLPIVLCPYCLFILGVGWVLSSVGVYYRDISQITGTLVSALMFLSPIFYPLSSLPEWIRPWVKLNPITWPVETARAVMVFGRSPDLVGYVSYSVVAGIVAALGYQWFQKTRHGFADVL